MPFGVFGGTAPCSARAWSARLLDFPVCLQRLIAPWIELAALVLVASQTLGVITGGQLPLVIFIVALGSGTIATSALSADPARDGPTLFNLIVVGPVGNFLLDPRSSGAGCQANGTK